MRAVRGMGERYQARGFCQIELNLSRFYSSRFYSSLLVFLVSSFQSLVVRCRRPKKCAKAAKTPRPPRGERRRHFSAMIILYSLAHLGVLAGLALAGLSPHRRGGNRRHRAGSALRRP